MTAKKTRKKKSGAKRQGTLVIIGGHEDKEHARIILHEVARLLRKGKLVVSTIASSEPEDYFKTYQKIFGEFGIKHLTEIYICERSESQDEKKLRLLDGAAGIFFTGGDQLRISSQIGDTPLEARVREIYEQGGVIAGTSAGAAVMGEVMLVRGSSAQSFKVGDLHLAPGLGLMPSVIIDQHFAERGRIGRLLGAVAHNPRLLGIGIDEDTAVLAHDGWFSVIGSGAVYVVDGAGVTHTNVAEGKSQSTLTLFDVKLHVLSAGDSFDLKTRKPTWGDNPNEAEKSADEKSAGERSAA